MRSKTIARTSRFGALALMATALVLAVSLLAAKPAHAKTFTVNSPQDSSDINPGDGICDTSSTFLTPCTLRAAIEEANATKDTDTINFDIPLSGVQTISPSFGLPLITHPVLIDGYTQPGAKPNTLADGNDAVLKIELSGTSAGAGENGLTIAAANSTVKGLIINRWSDVGVGILGSGDTLQGNFIGTNAAGNAKLGNSSGGVFIFDAPDNTIGGTTAAARNIISGNNGFGVNIGGPGAKRNKVEGNFIGTNAAGDAALGNGNSGVVIGAASNNTIGGTTAAARNIISGNTTQGVVLDSPVATGNRILSNSIFSNGSLGIDLGNDGINVNDFKDADTGANKLQNFPALFNATISGTQITVKGLLASVPSTKHKKKKFTIQFFSSPQADPSGFGEGKTFLGQKKVTTGHNGDAAIVASLTPGQVVSAGDKITATATDSKGNTSEFSGFVTAT